MEVSSGTTVAVIVFESLTAMVIESFSNTKAVPIFTLIVAVTFIPKI